MQARPPRFFVLLFVVHIIPPNYLLASSSAPSSRRRSGGARCARGAHSSWRARGRVGSGSAGIRGGALGGTACTSRARQTSLTAPGPAFSSHDCTTARSPRSAAATTCPGTTILKVAMRSLAGGTCDQEPPQLRFDLCHHRRPQLVTEWSSGRQKYQARLCY